MAEPSVEEATNELRKAAEHIFRNDRDTFTVNSVRKAAAEELNVDLDFFKSAQWKDKSKDIIKACSVSNTAPVLECVLIYHLGCAASKRT